MNLPDNAHPGMSAACNFALDFQEHLAKNHGISKEAFKDLASSYGLTREDDLKVAFPDGSRAEWIEGEGAWRLDETEWKKPVQAEVVPSETE